MRSGPLWRGRDSEHITETSSRKQSGSTVHYRIYGLDGKLEIRGEVDVASAADIAADFKRTSSTTVIPVVESQTGERKKSHTPSNPEREMHVRIYG